MHDLKTPIVCNSETHRAVTKLIYYSAVLVVVLILLPGCQSQEISLQLDSQFTQTPTRWQTSLDTKESAVSLWGVELPEPIWKYLDEVKLSNSQIQVSALQMRKMMLENQIASATLWPSVKLQSIHRSAQTLDPEQNLNQLNTLGMSAAWEIDLWQRLADSGEQSYWLLSASRFELAAVQQSIQSQLLVTWLDVIEQHKLIDLNTINQVNQKRRLQMSLLRLDSGLAESLDVRIARTNLLRLQEAEKNILFKKNKALRRLQMILGRYPTAAEIESLELPQLKPLNVLETPKDILLGRPDILEAEAKLMAAGLAWRVAEKNKLPKLTLNVTYDARRSDVSQLFDVDSWLAAITSSLVQPIFNAGKLESQAQKAKLQQQIMLKKYQGVILSAWQEVENGLHNEMTLQQREILLIEALSEAKQAEIQTEEQYLSGLASSFELLAAQRTRINVESDVIKLATLRVKNRINLRLALGLQNAEKS